MLDLYFNVFLKIQCVLKCALCCIFLQKATLHDQLSVEVAKNITNADEMYELWVIGLGLSRNEVLQSLNDHPNNTLIGRTDILAKHRDTCENDDQACKELITGLEKIANIRVAGIAKDFVRKNK